MTKVHKFQIHPLDEHNKYAIERYNEVKRVYEVIGRSIIGLENAIAWEKDLNEKYEEECEYFRQRDNYED